MMRRGPSAKIMEEVTALIRFAGQHAGGFTRVDVESEFQWGTKKCQRRLRLARHTMASLGQNLLCRPNGQGQLWLYTLETNERPTSFQAAAVGWELWAVGYHRSRHETELSIYTSLMKALPRGSRAAHDVRRVARDLSRFLEDHAEMEELLQTITGASGGGGGTSGGAQS